MASTTRLLSFSQSLANLYLPELSSPLPPSPNPHPLSDMQTEAVKIGGEKSDLTGLEAACSGGVSVTYARGAGALRLDRKVQLVGATAWGFSHQNLAGES